MQKNLVLAPPTTPLLFLSNIFFFFFYFQDSLAPKTNAIRKKEERDKRLERK
jgi:hypothetical protein